MKIEKRWLFSFMIITCIAILGLFWKSEIDPIIAKNFLTENDIVGADVAWILAAAGLVLLMTPGLSFFYGGMVGKKKRNFHNVAEFCGFRSDFNSVGGRRF
ncbi:hypothetical protein HNQ03_002811 [Chryseobacterium sp. 16F]|uniref:Uncharacterized protein n=1 Tax=Frigoriflavimonas asaccharolytica TaxID=2735899 RepID=A0A8J8K6G4_9FLAO|nr:hypothetical protein [Frigoriflavimonas asaccharolytica]